MDRRKRSAGKPRSFCVPIMIPAKAARCPGCGSEAYDLRTSSFLPLRRENVLRNPFLIGFGQLQKPASVFKTGITLLNNAHNLTEHR